MKWKSGDVYVDIYVDNAMIESEGGGWLIW